MFEHNIHRSSKHEPRILGSVKNPASLELDFLRFKLIPIESNRVLLMRLDRFRRERPSNVSLSAFEPNEVSHLELSIHESLHHRVGPALWTYRGDSDKPDLDDLKPLRSPTDILGITFGKQCMIQMKLFAMEFDDDRYRHLLFDEAELPHFDRGIALGFNAYSPDGQILGVRLPDKEAIVMLHSGSASTGFNLVTQVPIPDTRPVRNRWSFPPPAFSANGMKFAVAAYDGTVSVYDVRNKLSLMVKEPDRDVGSVASLKFSSGILGREVLAFAENRDTIIRIVLLDPASFEIEETLSLDRRNPLLEANCKPRELIKLFFDPNGQIMYVQVNGRLHEWTLQSREGPEWWLGEEFHI